MKINHETAKTKCDRKIAHVTPTEKALKRQLNTF